MKSSRFVRAVVCFMPATIYLIYSLTAHAQTAEEAAAPAVSAGDTAWLLTSTALVMMMTAPGLALFVLPFGSGARAFAWGLNAVP